MDAVRVLFVDDSDDDVYLTTRKLRQAGLAVDVHTVTSTYELEHELRVWLPHVVVSDVRMPRFDGFQALELVRRCTPATPFVFLCGCANRNAARGLEQGAYAVVDKDHSDELPHVICSALAQHVTHTSLRDSDGAISR
jgi:CheY-like chemotaxis protein